MRRWFGSSAPAAADARAKRGRLAWIALAFLFSLPSGAAESSRPAPAEPADFLALPEKELEPLGEKGTANADNPIEVGDTYWLKVAGLEGPLAAVSVPTGSSSLSDSGWEVEVRKAEEAGAVHWEIGATPLKSGRLTLPALALLDPEKKPVARTRPFTLDVVSAIEPGDPNPQAPVPIKPPVSVSFPWALILGLALPTVVGVAGAVYGIRRWLKARADRVPAVVEPPRPEDVLAMEALAAVEQAGWAKAGQFKKHYFRVSEILKRYLGLRYDFEAAESTTHELVQLLESRHYCDAATIDKVESLFNRLDRVKFTDEVPDAAAASKAVEDARGIVQTTKRLPIVQEVAHAPR